MAMSRWMRFAYATFGSRAAKSHRVPIIAVALKQAHMTVRPEAYLAFSWMLAGIGAVLGTLMVMGTLVWLQFTYVIPPALWILVTAVPGLSWYAINAQVQGLPIARAKARAKALEEDLPYAANYIASMAGAGIVPAEIFRSLANQPVYGAVAEEASAIHNDMALHGADIVTALRSAVDHTRSNRFQDLLQGAITTITTGGDLTAYFYQKSKRLQFDNRVRQRNFLETVGVLAESYVTAAVAGPLFLLVVLAIFSLTGGAQFWHMQLIIFLMMPIVNLAFILGLRAFIPEV